ncbi:hypothetical protein [Propionicicella superfundia]|uniref:hypothetical protein n=1 Tax=Propionicicella superfundia TaxID=348582 RepID=UPI000413E569|nr:hypothetical protein [Propionicicella superfundia]
MAREEPGSWRHPLDSGLRLALTVPLLAAIAADLPRIVVVTQTLAGVQVGGMVITMAGLVILLGLLATGLQTVTRLWIVVVLLFCGQAWGLADAIIWDRPPVTWWPTGGAIVLACALAVWTTSTRRVLVVLPAILLLGLCRFGVVVLVNEPLEEAVAEAILMLEVVVMSAIISDVFRDSAAATDAALAERRGAKSQRAAASVYRDQLREVERFLHDEVVHALRAIAMDRERVPAEDAVRAAADAWQKLKPEREPPVASRDLMTALERLALDSPCEVELRGTAPALPPDVVEAVWLAAAEAVRNVLLHSGSARAEVVVAGRGRGVVVAVVDHGRGFDTSGTRLRGAQSSIVERMEAVGGSATIASDGDGTRVEVSWVPRMPDTNPAAVVPGRMALAAVPSLVGTVVVAALLAASIARPWPALAATAVVIVVGAIGVQLVRRGRMSLWYQAAMLCCAHGAIIVNVLALDPADPQGQHLWLINGVTPLVLLLIVSTTFGWGLAVVVSVVVTGFAAAWTHFGGEATVTHFILVLVIPSAWLGVLAMQMMIDRLSRRALEAWEAAARSDSHAHHLAARAEISERRLARIREEIGPFLYAVGDGALDPDSADVRRDAAVLEALVRDDIRFGGGSPAFRRQLTALRRGGWEVDVRMSTAGVRSRGDALLDLVLALPDTAQGASLVITSSTDHLVAVLEGLPPETVAGLAREWVRRGGDVLAADDFLRLTLPLTPVETPLDLVAEAD